VEVCKEQARVGSSSRKDVDRVLREASRSQEEKNRTREREGRIKTRVAQDNKRSAGSTKKLFFACSYLRGKGSEALRVW